MSHKSNEGMKIQSIISRAAQRNRFAMSMFFVVVVFVVFLLHRSSDCFCFIFGMPSKIMIINIDWSV